MRSKQERRAEFTVIVTNHSARQRSASCRAVLPTTWAAFDVSGELRDPVDGRRTTQWVKTDIPARSEGKLPLSLSIPTDAEPGRYVIPIDVQYDPWSLPQFTEAILVL
jgi:hypothetical protein